MEWNKHQQYAQQAFERAGAYCACWFALTLPWSLTLSYVGLFPLIILWLPGYASSLPALIKETKCITLPFLFLIAAFLLSGAFGVDALRSLRAIPATLFFAVTMLAIRAVVLRSGPLPVVSSLVIGQSVAALQSALFTAFPSLVPKIFLGAVTEAGQLAITILVATGLAFSLVDRAGDRRFNRAPFSLFSQATIMSVLWTGLAYASSRHGNTIWSSAVAGLLVLGLIAIAVQLYHDRVPAGIQTAHPRALRALYLIAIPLLITALIVNLKRGPWMGVFMGGTIFLLLYHPRLLFPLIGLALVGLITLEPVRDRIAEIPEHFFIIGGRSMMWDIGVELATRYPLGVGLRNSRFLQTFSAEIPPELNHFHNNFINIAVEGGWLALMMFGWWILNILRYAFSEQQFGKWAPLACAIGCAVVSWQVAGLVEYNWGDSEVRLLVFLVLGSLLGIKAQQDAAPLLKCKN